MKVLHINCNYLGTALHQTMVEHLDRFDVDSTVFAPTYNPQNAIVTPNQNVVVSKCFRKWDRLFFFFKQWKIQKALVNSLSVGDFDMIHAYTLFTDGNCAYEMFKKFGVDYVVAVRSTDVSGFFKYRPHLIKRGVQIMRNAKCVCFLSEAYKQLVLQKYVPSAYREELAGKCYVIPNGIDDFWLQNLNADCGRCIHSPLRLVYAGTLIARKNIPMIQSAISILKEKGCDAQLTVVGRAIDKTVYQQVCRDEYTEYIPPTDKKGLVRIYRDNDIFIMPSFAETFGLVYAEAISQGLPVVYSAGEGFDKQFEDGEVGYPADPGSAESVANAVLKIAQNYQAITTGLSAKAKCYDWNRICSQYYTLYQPDCH